MSEENKTKIAPHKGRVLAGAPAQTEAEQPASTQNAKTSRGRRRRSPQSGNAQNGLQNAQNGQQNTQKGQQNAQKGQQNTQNGQQNQQTAQNQGGQSIPSKAPGRRGRPRKNTNPNSGQPQTQSVKSVEAPKKSPLRIIPLGGLGEIGKNMTVFEYQNDMFIVDCGLAFPDDDMPGIDLVIPDFTYVVKNKDRLRGIVLTHGHEDHIGAVAYLLKEVDVPVYGTRLTLGLLDSKLKEHGLSGRARLHVVKQGATVKMGCMSVEFIGVNHSIPDGCGLAIFTPVGTLIHTGDFKIDYTPVDGPVIDLARFGELGKRGVLALMTDTTNAERPGQTPSERKVGEALDILMKKASNKRIIVASFSSNVHRVQQIIDCAHSHKRKIVVSGRSMENVVSKATELGYLKIPRGIMVELDQLKRYPDNQIVLITTGSQGEPMSALTRMANNEHRKVSITPNDYIIISASPIPGNEKLVGRVINELMKLGADVAYEKSMGIHVSGHASQDDIKMIIGLTRPKFFIPVHGEYKHMKKGADLAMEMGIKPENILIGEIGRVIELDGSEIKAVTTVPAGSVMVDGLGVGDVGSVVLRDRKLLAEDGLMVVAAAIEGASGRLLSGPDIVSRGFVYVKESEELMGEARAICRQALIGAGENGIRDWTNLKQLVKDQLGQYLYGKTKRRPMILPIIQEI